MALQMNQTVHHEEDMPLDVFNYNVKKLVDAKTQTIVVLSQDMLTAAGRTITDFQVAVARTNHMHHIVHLSAYVVGVQCTEEQFQHAIKFYESQESTKMRAEVRRFRKAWKRNAEQSSGVVGMGFLTFLLPPAGLTADEFVAGLKPVPTLREEAVYVHPSGLNDKILLLATTQERMDELRFKTALTHIAKVHALEGVVHSVADPEAKGRAQIRVKFLQDHVKNDSELPWADPHPLPAVQAGEHTHFPVPLEHAKVRVYLTWNGEGGYIMTYGQMLLSPNAGELNT